MKRGRVFAIEIASALREMTARERDAVLRVYPDLIHMVVAAAAPVPRRRHKRRKQR